MSLPLNQIIQGDCIEVLQGFPENSVDLVVTDPPYGLGFMGKEWDKALPPKEAFNEMYRVLKPGGLAFVMSSPRQDLVWRMCALLEGSGFELSQSFISWIYKTGFPKAYDVSKGIDKRPNRLQKNPFKEYCNIQRNKLGLTFNQINIKGQWATTGGGMASGIMGDKKNNLIPSIETYEKIKEILNLDNRFDSLIVEAEREIIGQKKTGDPVSWYAETERGDGVVDITVPALVDSKKWDGWKAQTGLKPALEPILMVNKPFSESTIVDNVLRWGTGAINIDACRIPFKSEKDKDGAAVGFEHGISSKGSLEGWKREAHLEYSVNPPSSKGRFPANLLVSDDVLNDGEVSKSGLIEPHHKTGDSEGNHYNYGIYGERKAIPQSSYGDEGSKSRYFDLDAWAEHRGFLDVAKPSSSERDFGLKNKKTEVHRAGHGNKEIDDVTERFRTLSRNIHPTVKPIKLMAYLIELGCPKNGVVLDPFVGSGTTCIAAKRLCRRYIGIELSPEYHALAVSRVAAYPDPLEWFSK